METRLRVLFIEHFIAKAFRWTPKVMEEITADELESLVYIESEKNKKEERDANMKSKIK